MKKSILVVMLAAVLVVPAFAATSSKPEVKKEAKQETKKCSKIDIVGKMGVTLNPQVKSRTDDYDYDLGDNIKNSFMIGVEGLYKFDEKISAGIGINYIFAANFDTKFDYKFEGTSDPKFAIGFTNIYATIKPKLSDSIYAIAQIGYGIPNFTHATYSRKYWDVNAGGIYGGLGAGIEYKSFIFEALYSMNSANMKCTYESYGIDYVFRYSTLSFNIGYKFSL